MAMRDRRALGRFEAPLSPSPGGALRLGTALALAAFLLTAARRAEAYRPFDGTDADVAPVGELELELGPTHYVRQGGRRYVVTPATVLNLGVVRGLELVVDFRPFVGLRSFPDESRLRVLDTDVLVKWMLRRGTLQDETGVSVALESGLLVPEFAGENRFGVQANLVVSYRFSALEVHLNEQAALSRTGNLDVFGGAIVEGPHRWWVRPVAELFAERELSVGSTYSGLVGAIWAADEAIAVDIALRHAKVESERATEVRFGFTWALPLSRSTRSVTISR